MRRPELKAGNPFAKRIYAALLLMYPAAFRRKYGEELRLLFAEMQQDAAEQGMMTHLRLWLTVLGDLATSATRERMRTMPKIKWTTIISAVLCLPLLVVVTMAVFNYEPPFVQTLERYLTAADGYTPTLLGQAVMLALLLSVPAAFVINLLPMLAKRSAENTSAFAVTPAHTVIGVAMLALVMALFSQQVLRELRPFVAPLGAMSVVGQTVFLLGLIPLPMSFLLNRFPRLIGTGSSDLRMPQPTSATLIVGATILLIILMMGSAFALEATACSMGVPNCD